MSTYYRIPCSAAYKSTLEQCQQGTEPSVCAKFVIKSRENRWMFHLNGFICTTQVYVSTTVGVVYGKTIICDKFSYFLVTYLSWIFSVVNVYFSTVLSIYFLFTQSKMASRPRRIFRRSTRLKDFVETTALVSQL